MAKGDKREIWYIKPPYKEGAKPFWIRVGIALENKDGSESLFFDVVPPHMDNLQIRDITEREERGKSFDE